MSCEQISLSLSVLLKEKSRLRNQAQKTNIPWYKTHNWVLNKCFAFLDSSHQSLPSVISLREGHDMFFCSVFQLSHLGTKGIGDLLTTWFGKLPQVQGNKNVLKCCTNIVDTCQKIFYICMPRFHHDPSRFVIVPSTHTFVMNHIYGYSEQWARTHQPDHLFNWSLGDIQLPS